MPETASTPPNDDVIRHPELPKTVEELEAYIPHLLNRLFNRWNLVQNRDLSAYGVNATMLRIMSVLFIHKTLTVNEIASHAVVEQSNASRNIDAMVESGLLDRQIAQSDLRLREIVLTKKGDQLLHQLWPVMARNHERLVGQIPKRDLVATVRTLQAMIRNTEKS